MSTSIIIQLCCYFTLFAAHLVIPSGADNVNNDSLDEAVISTCPTWYMPASDDSEKCVCGDNFYLHNNNMFDGTLKCLPNERVSLCVGFCMTYTDNQTLVGKCPYNVGRRNESDVVLPKNVSELNEFMCGPMNRTGLLCSQCKTGFTNSVLSYQRQCVECSDTWNGVALFLVLAILPTTIFYLIIVSCKIDISSGPMNAVLGIIQTLLAETNRNPAMFIFMSYNYISNDAALIMFTLIGIWNLDFFRYVIPPFCISPSLTSLQAEALEYVIAIYPLLLVVVTYILVEWYDRGNYLLMLMWVPFRRLFSHKCFKDWNIKNSLLTTFATFIQLSFLKFFFISENFLLPNRIFNMSGDVVHYDFEMDPSVSYFSKVHIPYAILAIVIFITFNLLPILLFLFYPTKWFQKLLGCFPHVNWHPLHAFMDIFQGCYKNGTNGTRDYRYFAGLNLLFRSSMRLPEFIIMLIHTYLPPHLVVIPLLYSYMHLIFKPYKKNVYNMWDTFCYFLYAMAILCTLCKDHDPSVSLDLLYLSYSILFIYLCLVCIAKTVQVVTPGLYASCTERAKDYYENFTFRNLICCFRRKDLIDPERASIEDFHQSHDDEDYQPLLGKESPGLHGLLLYGTSD